VKTVTTVAEARAWRRAQRGSVGLVPTMGALHDGHLSLVERARRENDQVAASVFVNPTQFGPHEDLGRYPRDLARDTKLLEDAGVDLLFAPEPTEMYPQGFATAVEVAGPSQFLEGERRPGHFRGVATVVLKLFGIAQPDRAYFGQKDAQQLAVVRRMVKDLDVPVEIVGCPIRREADGLALSSRNVYLSPDERRGAPVLFRSLEAARQRWEAGERDASAIRAAVRAVLATEPLARPDYVSVADPETFVEAEGRVDAAIVLLAVFFGKTRLIDNLPLGEARAGR
jgi:pantoate--beta-alanine ligase